MAVTVKSRTRRRWSRQVGWINYGFWCPSDIAAKVRQMADERLAQGNAGSEGDVIRSLTRSALGRGAPIREWAKKSDWIRYGLTWPPEMLGQLDARLARRRKHDRNASLADVIRDLLARELERRA